MPRELISESAREEIKAAIKESDGNELFFVGKTDSDTKIESVKVVARGNINSVPAIIEAADPGDIVVHNHPSGNIHPSPEDVQTASVFGNQGIGFYITDNSATEVYVVVEPFQEQHLIPLDEEEVQSALMPEGAIARKMGGGYELRREQLEMANSVCRSFNDDEITIIEAGTGTGKTLAYLVPAVKWAISNGERVVVSTNTINLQEQLIEKDIPLLEEALGEKFTYSLVKGMGNYVCLLRAETVSEGLFDMAEDDEVDPLGSILEWIKVTRDGSLSDLSFSPPDSVWDKVTAESDSCLRVRCPYYSNCFFYKSRREIASSQLLVVNHHLLFSDLAIKGASEQSDAGILPPYRRVIFDEAHHIPDSATSHFGMRTTKFGIIRLLRRLKRKSKNGDNKGLIYYASSLAAKLTKYFRKGALHNMLLNMDSHMSPRIDEAETYTRDAFDFLYGFALESANGNSGDTQKDDVSIRVTESLHNKDEWEEVDRKFSLLRIKLIELREEIKAFLDLMIDYEEENEVAKLIVEFRGVANKLEYYGDVASSFLSKEDDGLVRWIEGRTSRGSIISGIGLSPLDISMPLNERLFSKCGSVVLTSATMAVNKSFKFIKTELGLLDNERVGEQVLLSPFNYEDQLLLTIPDDIPEPLRPEFAEVITEIIRRAVIASGGNALVLFTSYALLQRVHKEIYESLELSGVITLKQGSMPRSRLLDKLRNEESSVLFATDSFWEGVDVPGESLRLVIITRLPFRVPTDPIVEARVEHMESEGINSFLEYSVPVAVLKFKQGFGRLIRSKSDTGAVLILDRRITTKFYGKYFLDSLPKCPTLITNTEKVLGELRKFYSMENQD